MRSPFSVVVFLIISGAAVAQTPNIETRLPPNSVTVKPAPLPLHSFGGHTYHGQTTWDRGKWHHTIRNGRLGWWWDVGGAWYFYPQATEGPPAYISETEIPDETQAAPEPPPAELLRAYYYRPGNLIGRPYDTVEECTKAIQQAGNVGVCVLK